MAMKLTRAWSTIDIKSATVAADGKRRFSGIATTPATDRMGDIVEPKGAQFKLPIPLLWQHDAAQPIGWVTAARIGDKGIEIDGEIASVSEEGALRSRLDEAWQSLKAKLVRGLSIGFNPVEYDRIERSSGYRFLKWEWLELSAVTIPANQEATIVAVKSHDARQHAAAGNPPPRIDPPPGAPGHRKAPAAGGFSVSNHTGVHTMKTIAQLIEERETKSARLQELAQLKASENRRFTGDESIEFDGLADDIEGIDDEIRTAKAAQVAASRATAVDGSNQRSASQSRGYGPTIIVRKTDPEDKFKGQSFVRRVIAKALAQIHGESTSAIAEALYGKTHPQLVQWIKADVAGGGSGSGEWGAELVSADNRFTGDFIEYLYSQTVFDALPLRSVPANVTIKGQDGSATANWVGESKGIPATTADFSTVSLTPLKVAAIAVVSNELLRDSSPSAEMLVRDALVEASGQKVDSTFLSTTAASSGVSPAGLLNGVTIGSSGGTTEAELIGDIVGLTRPFITAKYRLDGLVWVTTPLLAMQIALMRNTLGQNAFPGMSGDVKTLEGRRVYTGHNVGAGDLILLSPSDVWKIGDGGVQVSISRDAVIEQSDSPAGATDTPAGITGTKFTSMFQEESTAIKVVRSVNFQKRRSTCVQYIGNATYGDINSV
jgi:HK97 family phage major capsid protein/HK97 family phage prohead protease